MMRRMLIIVILLALFCGCAQEAEKGVDDTADAQICCYVQDLPHILAVCGDGYYCILKDRLYYIDKEDRMTPVCANPLCDHRTDDCAAFFPPPMNDVSASVFYTDSGIYVFSGAVDRQLTKDGTWERSPKVLWRIDPAENTRKQVVRLDTAVSMGSVTVYSDHLYCLTEQYDSNAESSFDILDISLRNGRTNRIYSARDHARPHCAVVYRNKLYFSLTREGDLQRRWYCMDLTDKSREPGFVAGDESLTAAPLFAGEKMILIRADPAEADGWNWSARPYIAAETGEEELEIPIDAYGVALCDGQYLYAIDNPYIPSMPQAEKTLRVYALDGEPAAGFVLGRALPAYESVYLTPGDPVFVLSGDGRLYRISKKELLENRAALHEIQGRVEE